MFTALGIAESDEQVYRCCVDHGRVTVADIAASLRTSEHHVLQCLTRLKDLGLLYVTGRGHYRATDPESALLPLLARRQWEAETALASARTEIDRIAERHRAGRLRSDPDNLVEVLSDRELILERIDEIGSGVTSHV